MKKIFEPFPKTDRITLIAGQSLVLNDGAQFANKVHKHTNPKIDKHHLESFGLFDSATPNFATYYPGVTADDLAPKEGDFVYPIFRCLSEVIVRKSFDPIDFTKNGVLKASMTKLLGQTVYPNHEALIGNELGVVSKVFWDDAYEIDGVKVPAGINAEFKIDGKSHPSIARGVTSDPPSIHSNSVTVNFQWEKSHSKMSDEEFRAKVGTYDAKRELIRRIASDIVMYNETSFVPHGADPFAQRVNAQGKINNPKYAATRDSFNDDDGRPRRFFAFSYKDDLASLTEQTILKSDIISNNENEKPINMNKGLILLLASIAGITIDAEQAKLSEEDFQAQFDHEAFNAQLEANKATLESLADPGDEDEDDDTDQKLADLEAEVESLKADKITLEQFKTENEAKVTLVDKVRTDLLKEVKRLYALSGKSNDTMLSKLEEADYSALKVFEISFKEQLEEKYPAKCTDCGSSNVSMGSADAEDEGGEKPKGKSATMLEIKNRLRNKPISLKHITGE